MKWKFWQRKRSPDQTLDGGAPPPGPLHPLVVRHLVDELELGAEWVRTLYGVTRIVAGEENVHAFRAFSPSETTNRGITVCNYASLDGYRQVILFSGIFNAVTGTVNMVPEIKWRSA